MHSICYSICANRSSPAGKAGMMSCNIQPIIIPFDHEGKGRINRIENPITNRSNLRNPITIIYKYTCAQHSFIT